MHAQSYQTLHFICSCYMEHMESGIPKGVSWKSNHSFSAPMGQVPNIIDFDSLKVRRKCLPVMAGESMKQRASLGIQFQH